MSLRQHVLIVYHGHSLLDDVLQLPDVSGIVVGLEFPGRSVRQHPDLLVVAAVVLVQEFLGQKLYVVRPLPKGRNGNVDDVQPVIQVLSEKAFGYQFRGDLVYGGDDPHIDGDVPGAAHSPDVGLLQDPQKLGLKVVGHGGYLVQQDGAAVGLLEKSCPVHRSRESALGCSEKYALQKALRDGRAVLGQEGLPRPGPVVMYALGYELLARTGLPVDEHRRVVYGRLAGPLQHLQEPLILSENIAEGIFHDLRSLDGHVLHLSLLDLQKGIRDPPEVSNILGNFHGCHRPALHNHRNGGILGGYLLAVEVLVGLLGVPSGLIPDEGPVYGTLTLFEIRESFVELLPKHVPDMDLFGAGHGLVVVDAHALPVHDVYAFVQELYELVHKDFVFFRVHNICPPSP